jgi:peptidoglycan/xylan/chitin deacetylase (PgdA/CDA1 family)
MTTSIGNGALVLNKDNPYYKTTLDSNKVTVLMYHHILEEKDIDGTWEDNSAVLSLEAFTKEMAYLYENNYNVLTLEAFNNYVNLDETVPEKSVLITFDDGYKSDFVYAYDVLKAYDFHATVFLITSQINQVYEETFDPDKLQFVSMKELEDCQDVFSYGDHTYDLHRIDSTIHKAYMLIKDYDEIDADFKKSSEMIADLIDPETKAFAYPYGVYNYLSMKALNDNDYKLAFLTINGQVTTQVKPYYIPRYGISSQEDFDCLFK